MWQHSTLIIPSLTARRQSNAASVHKLHDSVVRSVNRARHRHRWCVRQDDQVIDQYEVAFFTCNIHKR